MDPAALDRLEDQLTKAYRLLTDQPHASKHGTEVQLSRTTLSMADLSVVVSHGDRDSALFRIRMENRELRDEIRRLKGTKGLQWADFVEACSKKVDTDTRTWRNVIATALGLSRTDLQSYEKHNRVPMTVLRKLDEMPVHTTVSDRKQRRERSFAAASREIVTALRQQGWPASKIAPALTELLRTYDGNEVRLNHIFGVRLTATPDNIRPRGDTGPITRQEVMAMATALWGAENNIRSMETFVQTHIQVDIRGYTHKQKLQVLSAAEGEKLREAFHDEMALRQKNPRYERFSLAFANLSKRPKKKQKRTEASRISYQAIAALAKDWFGEDAIDGLCAISGYDIRTIRMCLSGERAVPQQLEDLILTIQQCLDGLYLDEANFVEIVFRRVKGQKLDAA